MLTQSHSKHRCLIAVAFLLFVFLHITPASTVVQARSKVNRGLDLFAFDKKKACCTTSNFSSAIASVAPEYETYRLAGTYYSLNGLTATLMFNNKGPESILATPTFYSLAGTRLQLAPISIPAASYLEVDLGQLLAGTADEFREGNVKISYQGGDYQLGAQIKLVDPAHKLIWAEQLVYPAKFSSSKLENVWWLPAVDAATRLVVTNTTSGPITAVVRVDGTSPDQTIPAQITLSPWESRVLDIMRDVVGEPNGSLETKGGISITHTGSPGGVLARMFIAKPNRGYSATAPFIDPEATNSQKWHGGGLRLKNVDGSDLRPLLVARNAFDRRARLSGKIIYTRPTGDLGEVAIPLTQIPAGTTRAINLDSLIDNANVPDSVDVAGIELEYDTPKGTLVTSVQSVSANGEHVFQVPMFDPQRMPSSAGGFPWKADGDYRTLVYIKNETTVSRRYTASLVYPGGGYTLAPTEIRPGETVVLDFKKFRDDQVPDSVGNLIPPNLDQAQIGWSARGGENHVLSGRSEQVSLSEGVASTYACYNCCSDLFVTGWIEPYSASIGIGNSLVYTGKEIYANCYMQQYPPNFVWGVNWLSYNSSIASIDSFSGDAEGIAPGDTWIEGSWTADQWTNVNGFCQYDPVPVGESEPIDVVGIQKVQYRGPNNSAYADAQGTLYVLRDSEVSFKAIPDPPTSSFPAGEPTWSGTSGASGTGATVSVAFSAESSSTSDFKTVVATAGSSTVTVNVVVFTLTGTLNPQTYFTGRSQTRYGLSERVNLGFITSPSVTAQQLGGLVWSVTTGTGTISPGSDGSGTYTAPGNASSETLMLKIATGPSKDGGYSVTKTVVAPGGSVARQTPGTAVGHTNGNCSVGFSLQPFLTPTDVSFAELGFMEGNVAAVATGYYSALNGDVHPISGPTIIEACDVVLGCRADFTDLVSSDSPVTPCSTGQFTWAIPWKYVVNANVDGAVTFSTATHLIENIPSDGVRIRKAGVGPFTKVISDPTTTVFP